MVQPGVFNLVHRCCHFKNSSRKMCGIWTIGRYFRAATSGLRYVFCITFLMGFYGLQSGPIKNCAACYCSIGCHCQGDGGCHKAKRDTGGAPTYLLVWASNHYGGGLVGMMT